MDQGSSLGVVGIFLILLGAGLILDADCIRSGFGLVGIGAWCLCTEGPRPGREDGPSR